MRETDAVTCSQTELVTALALGALSKREVPGIKSHLNVCAACRREFELHRAVIAGFGAWPADELPAPDRLWDQLLDRIGVARSPAGAIPADSAFQEPQWEVVAPGISCKLLATDMLEDKVSMLVRLEPNASYPGHTHAGCEELHLLDGELYIDNRKLYPGDYYRAEAGTSDRRVWSETGCTCVLVTSTRDQLAAAAPDDSAP